MKIALNEYLTLPFFNQLIRSELALLLWLKHVFVLRRHVFSIHLATFSFKFQLQGLLFLLSLKGPWNLAPHLKHNPAFFRRACLASMEGSSYCWMHPRAPHSLLQTSEELQWLRRSLLELFLTGIDFPLLSSSLLMFKSTAF